MGLQYRCRKGLIAVRADVDGRCGPLQVTRRVESRRVILATALVGSYIEAETGREMALDLSRAAVFDRSWKPQPVQPGGVVDDARYTLEASPFEVARLVDRER